MLNKFIIKISVFSSALSSSPVSEGSSRPGSGLGGLTPSSQQQAGQLPGSGVKKRVSLADYKRRKASTSATPSGSLTFLKLHDGSYRMVR